MKKSMKFEISYEKEEYFRGRDKKVLEISFKTNIHNGGSKNLGLVVMSKKSFEKVKLSQAFFSKNFVRHPVIEALIRI
jgi:hypothetical protein